MNAVAGGGTLLTFPALLAAGVPALTANATSTVALVPGSASAFVGFRGQLRGDRRLLLAMAAPSVLGGVGGTLLALAAGEALFARLVPWLILGATGLFVASEPLGAWVRRRSGAGEEREVSAAGIAAFQLIVAIYGGFFGAGIGILMLASLALAGVRDVHRMNALKNFAAVCINGVSAITFAFSGLVQWRLALAMALAAIVGGQVGAGFALRIGQRNVRRMVVLVGLAIGAAMLIQQARDPGAR